MPNRRDAADIFEIHRMQATIDGHEVVAGVQPLCGANLVSLRVDGHEYLHYDDDAARRPERVYSGCFVMFPTPCRLRDGRYEVHGEAITQRKAGRLVDIHGLVRDEPFEFCLSEGGIDLHLDITPDHPVYEGYPFPGRLSLRMQLMARGLEYSFSFENHGRRPAPVGFGLHPYWRIPGRREDVCIRIPFGQVMLAEELIPTGPTRPVAGTPLDLRQTRPLEGLDLDNVFLERLGDDPARIEFRDIGKCMTLRADEVFSHQVLYTPPGKPFVCVEDLTCAPNAMNLQSVPQEVSGFRVIGPGEVFGGTTRFVVENLQ